MTVLDSVLLNHLRNGTVLPAHPLALKEDRTIDERRQRQLSRYYMASGAGGMAVGVHSTQFEIRDPKINLFESVLQWASEEVDKAALQRPFLKIAGICGPTDQAEREAELAIKYDYDMGLLSMGGLQQYTEDEILERVRRVASIIPVFGFYLQPSVGGRIFTYDFWLKFCEIDNVMAIKCASFNRYQTLDVMRAVCNSSRCEEIAMYTGNDDNIVADLMTTYRFTVDNIAVEKKFVGGLLGHWAVWTHRAVSLLDEVKSYRSNPDSRQLEKLLSKGVEITDVNAAMFDPAHHFEGCIPGIHELLRRQNLLDGIWCLNPSEGLSEGQFEELNRVCSAYPHLNDDEFVAAFLQHDQL